MAVYFSVLTIVCSFAYFSEKVDALPFRRFLLFIPFSVMVIVAGLRSPEVGSDTWTYIRLFKNMTSLDAVFDLGWETFEFGYWFCTWILHSLSDDYMVLLFAIALVVVWCYQRAILAYSVHVQISFFTFITMGFYTFFFNGARQGIACAICALAIGPLKDRKFGKYLLFVLIASLFHKSALAMVPVYFLFRKVNSLKTNVIYGIVGIFIALTIQNVVEITSLFDERYQYYATSGAGGGYLTVLFYCFLTLFFMIFKNSVKIYREEYNSLLNLLIFGTLVSVISAFFRINPSGFLRMSLYFNISLIFLWPIVYKNIYNRAGKNLFSFVFISMSVLYFILSTQRFSDLTPYLLNSSLSF